MYVLHCKIILLEEQLSKQIDGQIMEVCVSVVTERVSMHKHKQFIGFQRVPAHVQKQMVEDPVEEGTPEGEKGEEELPKG